VSEAPKTTKVSSFASRGDTIRAGDANWPKAGLRAG